VFRYLAILLITFGLTACNPLSVFHKDTKEAPKALKEVVVKPTTSNILKPKVHKKAPKVHKDTKVPKETAHLRSKSSKAGVRPHYSQKDRRPASQREVIRDCKADFYKTNCVALMPNRKAVEACMRAKKDQLAPICRRHL
jgi:hypothetical protein